MRASVTFRTRTKTQNQRNFLNGALRLHTKTSSRKTDSKSALIDYLKSYKKVSQLMKMLHHLAAVKFLWGVSIPFWVGQVLCCVEGKFLKTRLHTSDPQSLGEEFSACIWKVPCTLQIDLFHGRIVTAVDGTSVSALCGHQ